ncbi:L-ribulose-5-phosphate 4-epimerase AraD [Amphibacillus cookii]|uniref:L-ribulose-5-phosphate 4-epimerase AraD n=1 Tax=Amphibacillus cookii TaxID=767787 RepID=UPI00195A86CD
MIDEMKERVFKANLKLPELGLVVLTWGNVSEINRELGVIVIKPSGLDYSQMTSSQMVVTDMEGEPLEGGLKPSSDLKSHVILYQHFEEISAIVHTHSRYAVSWSQSGRDLPVYGTTHADTFYGPVPTTRQLNNDEVDNEYEMNTGKVIVKTFQERQLSPLAIPGILVNGHGPFTWGANPNEAVENSLVLDEICSMAQLTETIMTSDNFLPQYVLDKHYFRKHGKNAYYGQK